jgi:hypothetical protein
LQFFTLLFFVEAGGGFIIARAFTLFIIAGNPKLLLLRPWLSIG